MFTFVGLALRKEKIFSSARHSFWLPKTPSWGGKQFQDNMSATYHNLIKNQFEDESHDYITLPEYSNDFCWFRFHIRIDQASQCILISRDCSPSSWSSWASKVSRQWNLGRTLKTIIMLARLFLSRGIPHSVASTTTKLARNIWRPCPIGHQIPNWWPKMTADD